MAVSESDLTIVFQGPIVPGPEGTAGQILRTRRAFPRARVVLSTWERSDYRGISVDQIVLSEDPGGLPGIKRRDGPNEFNNVKPAALDGLRPRGRRHLACHQDPQ
jgi:hypothetical protein